MIKSISRRDFMKGMAVGGVAIGSAGLLSACSSSSSSTSTSSTDTSSESSSTGETAAVEKPASISLMFDGTVVTQANGQAEFFEKLTELTGIDYDITQPDHDAYYDVLGQIIAGGDWPDVILLSSTYYSAYAQAGVIWDMTDVYEGSDLQSRVEASGSTSVVDGMYVNGRLYGMPTGRGNGCLTYIKQAWLDAAGLSAPTTYDEYLEVLEAFSNLDMDGNGTTGNNFGVSASGFIGSDSPYVNYLPEFYQDAWPSFYQQDDGTWADGFTEDSMKEAIQRLADAYAAGLIDPTSLDQGTKDARNKFYAEEFGVFTYWAGTWATNLKNNLENNGVDSELVALPPIAEVPYYYDRLPVTWCITTACKNPEAVFEYFISAMHDGGDVEFAWTYGVEGVHWSTAAETLYEGTDSEVTYEEGQFHMLDNLETPGTQYTKNHLDPMLELVAIEDDPQEETVAAEARNSQQTFNDNCKTVTLVPSTDAMEQYNGDLTTLKNELIALVVTGQLTVDEAYARFESEGGAGWSEQIVASLNEL
ncbi:MAG: substrate-binding domain-containing protein [Lachnospiraceae bacterium]|nr:substrate-binding domain-containing protein [Lachnospiraceae bacterium]